MNIIKRCFFVLCLLVSEFGFGAYYSQCKQDKFVNERFFKNYQEGVFVDIGAHNGMTYSNTYFFEKELGWKGICIEPMPERFAELRGCRSCICVQGCISDREGVDQFLMVTSPFVNTEMLSGLLHKYDPRHLERVDIECRLTGGSYQVIDVQCYLLNKLLEENNITHINFLSIDTEGGEFEILSSIDFSKFIIDVITVENNYNDPRYVPFLEEKGYDFITSLAQDFLFVRKGFSLP